MADTMNGRGAPNYTLRQQIMRKVRLMQPGQVLKIGVHELLEAFPKQDYPLPRKSTTEQFMELMPGGGYVLTEIADPRGYELTRNKR